MGGKRLGFSNFWEFLRLCWLFGWWASIGATLVATYILGNCWRCFLEQLEVGEKNPSDCYGLPTAAQISPPPPPPTYMWGRGFTSWGDYLSWKICPPTPCRDQWPLMVPPPPPPTPSCEAPAGVLEIRTGNLKIATVGVLCRKIPAFPRTCYTPLPLPPPSCRGGGGDEARGVHPFPS
jgi:hypothetical protein